MFGGLLSVAGALVSVYIVFALLVSHTSEALSAILNKRGETLYDGIVALLGGTERTLQSEGSKADAKSLAEYLYEHPLISTLGSTKDRRPSYMEPRTFTLSLVSVLRDNVRLAETQAQPRLVDIKSTPEVLLADLQDRIAALGPEHPTCKSLTLVLQGAARTYDDALKAIDAWFDTQMDRLSGAYRRWIGVWQAFIALVFVGLANADTIGILHQLSANAGVAAALGRHAAAAGSTDAYTLQTIADSGLQLGWSAAAVPREPMGWLAKIGGLLLTWGAVLLGAPFWFDLLKRIVPIRATGVKPGATSGDARDAQVKAS